MLDELYSIIETRKKERPPGSYTCKLLDGGENLILRKIGEESLEVILAAKGEGNLRLIEETADLIYHLYVLLAFKEIPLETVKDELCNRHQRKQ
jgi:phosphoribosyl-ATP pyrophosphohydrolase